MNAITDVKTLALPIATVLALALAAPVLAGGSGAACNFSVTNNYEDESLDKGRTVFVYKGDDSIMTSSYQYDTVEYGDTEDFNCGSGQSKCKIKWTDDNSINWAVIEWTLGSKSVDCDETYTINSGES